MSISSSCANPLSNTNCAASFSVRGEAQKLRRALKLRDRGALGTCGLSRDTRHCYNQKQKSTYILKPRRFPSGHRNRQKRRRIRPEKHDAYKDVQFDKHRRTGRQRNPKHFLRMARTRFALARYFGTIRTGKDCFDTSVGKSGDKKWR